MAQRYLRDGHLTGSAVVALVHFQQRVDTRPLFAFRDISIGVAPLTVVGTVIGTVIGTVVSTVIGAVVGTVVGTVL